MESGPATMYLPTKTGNIQLLYRMATIQWNDGTTSESLQYHSTCGGGWFNSSEKDTETFINEKLLPYEQT